MTSRALLAAMARAHYEAQISQYMADGSGRWIPWVEACQAIDDFETRNIALIQAALAALAPVARDDIARACASAFNQRKDAFDHLSQAHKAACYRAADDVLTLLGAPKATPHAPAP